MKNFRKSIWSIKLFIQLSVVTLYAVVSLHLWQTPVQMESINREESPQPILFTSNRDGNTEVYRMNEDGTNQQRLTDSPENEGGARWSPDGLKIVFVKSISASQVQIWAMNADGSNKLLISDAAGQHTLHGYSPNGQKILFARKESAAVENLWTMNPDGSNKLQITNAGTIDHIADWSPDSSKIAFGRCTPQFVCDVFRMNADGSNQTNLTPANPNDDDGAKWTRDGSRIIFGSQNTPNDYNVYIMNADGTNKLPLTNAVPPQTYSPDAVSPDGNKVAMILRSDQLTAFEVSTVNLDGSGLTNLTNNSVFDFFGAWSPGGTKIALVSRRDTAANEIYAMNADGSGVIRLTFNTATENVTDWFKPETTPVVSGRVTYANALSATGVSFANLSAGGSIPLSTVTNSSGDYSLSGFGSGAYTITPSKVGQINGISNLDASRVAQHIVGLTVLNPTQIIAADTSGNGSVGALDAAYIAQFVAGIANPSITGQWKFVPQNRSYPNVMTSLMNQDYSAILVGEVTGNWNPLGAQQAEFLTLPSETSSTSLVSADGGNGARAQTFDALSSSDRYITSVNDYLQNYRTVSFTANTDSRSPAEQNQKLPVENVQAVTVTAPLLQSVNPGSMFTVDLMASNTTGEGILGYEFNLLYNQMVIVPGADPCDLTGTISSGRVAVCNPNTPGILSVVVFGPQPLTGAGILLRLNFTAVGMAGNASPLTFQNFLFNEGMPAAVTVNGSVVIEGATTPTPTPTATPTPTPPPTPLPTPTPPRRASFDFNGDGRSDLSVFRPSNGIWYLQNSQQAGFSGLHFGLASDRLAPADYDGDGKTDIAVFRPSNGFWYVQRAAGGLTARQLGAAEDIPQPADYDGDGRAELIVYRPSNGIWYIFNLVNNNFVAFQFGAPEDKPVIGDYDGDGRADIAVLRPSNGIWYVRTSANGAITGTQFGAPTDRPVPADYDGDGRTDVAVFRPSNGIWYVQGTTAGYRATQFGTATDEPTPGDYDGDGRADIAVYRPSEGNWYLRSSTLGLTAMQFGAAEDRPIPNAFVPR